MKQNKLPRSLILVSLACAAQLLSLPLALADIACGTTISSPGTYLLEADKSCPAGWLTIDSDDVEIDMQRYRVVYNTGGADTDLGVFINRASNVSIHDGTIIQGSSGSNAHPIRVLGASWASGVTLFNLQIETFGINVTGIQASGESYDFNEGTVHHVFVKNKEYKTNAASNETTRGMTAAATVLGAVTFHHNVCVGGHTGIDLNSIGAGLDTPALSSIYSNLVQHSQRPCSKSAYGIAFAGRSRNLEAYDNQVATLDGRGFTNDGWGDGVPRGTDHVSVHDNLVDARMTTHSQCDGGGYGGCGGGSCFYATNNTYGFRNRYSSGHNSWSDNIVQVRNDTGTGGSQGQANAFYVGSDSTDPLMTGLLIERNIVFAQQGTATTAPVVFSWDFINDIVVNDNEYSTEGSYEVGQSDIGSYTHSGNAELVRTATSPAAPTGLRLRRFVDDNYLLTWDASPEADVFHYLVYKDGAPIAQLGARVVRFYVDQDVVGAHDYAVVAQNLAGTTSPPSTAINTANAEDGWWGGQVAPPLDGGMADAGAADAGMADSAIDGGTTPPVDGATSTADQGTSVADGPQQDGAPSQNTLDGGGCGCRTGGEGAGSIYFLLGALCMLLWRRRRLSSALIGGNSGRRHRLR